MANKFSKWLGQNKLNVAFTAPDIASLAKGEDKLKSIKNIIVNLAFGTQIMHLMMSKAWGGMSKGLKSVISDTGSLKAAMDKLTKMQGLQKIFTPLVGGAAAAKTEVAKLVNLAASKGIGFDSLADAASNMRTLSRGAKGTAEDLDGLIDLSKATGASLEKLADGVGGVSAAMQSGGSIEGYIESLREAGGVTDIAAKSLVELQQNGGTTAQVMDKLAASMRQVAESGKTQTKTIDEVNRSYDSAQEKLKASVGSPWIAAEIRNTEIWAEVIKAVTPALAAVSNVLQTVYGSVVATGTAIAKFAVDTGIANALIYIFGAALAIVPPILAAIGAFGLAGWLSKGAAAFGLTTAKCQTCAAWLDKVTAGFIKASYASRVLAIGMRVLDAAMMVMKWMTIIALVADLAGMIFNLFQKSGQYQEQVNDLANASQQLNDKLRDQINHIETLADKYEALSAAMKASEAATAEYEKAKAEGKPAEVVEQLRRNMIKSQRTVQLARNVNVGENMDVAMANEERARKSAQTERDIAMEKASPEGKAALHEVEAERLGGMAAQGAAETTEREKTARARMSLAEQRLSRAKGSNMSDLDAADLRLLGESGSKQDQADAILQQVAQAKDGKGAFAGEDAAKLQQRKIAATALKKEGKRLEDESISNRDAGRKEGETAAAMKRELGLTNALLDASEDVSKSKDVGARLSVQQANADVAAIRAEMVAEEKKYDTGTSRYRSLQQSLNKANTSASEAERDLRVGQQSAERGISNKKAALAGDSDTILSNDAVENFAEQFEKLRPLFGDDMARDMARRDTESTVSLKAQEMSNATAAAAAVSDLAKVGGGGGVENVNSLMKRQIDLSMLIAEYTKKISEKEPGILEIK
jgi:hypothetical protein